MTAYINLEEVSFSWPRGQALVQGLNLAIEKHDTFALTGANGSGKTTLGKLIMGILTPTAGQVLLAGKPITSYSLAERGRRVGYVFQNPEKQLFAATVADEIGFALKYRGLSPEEVQNRVAETLALFELEQYAQTFPFNLSQGEKQRLALAAIMALGPDFVIMDEPSTGLDWLRKRRLQAILVGVRDRGVGYIIISHDHEFCAPLCARTLTLKGGKLA